MDIVSVGTNDGFFMQGTGSIACIFVEDNSWGPFAVLDTAPSTGCNVSSVGGGDPRNDLVVAMATFRNASSGTNGEAGGVVFVSGIRGWINKAISLEVIWHNLLKL